MSKISHDSETPAHGQQVITAVAVIHHVFDGATKILLPKRADTKKFLPSIYELPGGHIDFGEDIIAGLKREIQEELSVTIAIGDPFAAFGYTNHVKGSHSIEVIYFATLVDSPDAIKLHLEDHSSYEWVAKNELHKVISAGKGEDDIEIRNLRKAFDLLEGGQLDFAN
ncbi:MAG TPA: NUDIX hydrolase [Verrucomicrobiae bacterium]|nr:NUDIX hydrolase [Verrucomicrobiae bacterium]